MEILRRIQTSERRLLRWLARYKGVNKSATCKGWHIFNKSRTGSKVNNGSLSCGTSSETVLADGSIDSVVTDPPFFDNMHYSELTDFFYAWQQLDGAPADVPASTRSAHEVQDTRAEQFAAGFFTPEYRRRSRP